MPKHEHLEMQIAPWEIKHAPPYFVEDMIHAFACQFKLGERIKKLKPGEQIDMTIRMGTNTECTWGELLKVRIDDRFTNTGT